MKIEDYLLWNSKKYQDALGFRAGLFDLTQEEAERGAAMLSTYNTTKVDSYDCVLALLWLEDAKPIFERTLCAGEDSFFIPGAFTDLQRIIANLIQENEYLEHTIDELLERTM